MSRGPHGHGARQAEVADVCADEQTAGEAQATQRTLREALRRGWRVVECPPRAPHRFIVERDGRRIACGDASALRAAIGVKPTGGERR